MNLAKINLTLSDQPAYRIKQINKDLYQRLIADWSEATSLPDELRRKLAKDCPLEINARVLESKNKRTVKALMVLEDGLKIETVLMRYPKRNSVCVSTQVGCPVGCTFCATGKMGFKRNLTADEIVEQVVFFARYLKPFEEKVSRVVLMGMGEPFLNFEKTIKAIGILNDQQGLAIGARKISVSTVGLANKIRQFSDLNLQSNLALSLHAPTDKLRARLIPIHRQTFLKEIFEAVDYYLSKTKRKVMIEYIMLAGVNDSREQALQLAKLLGKRLVMVNLIRYNSTNHTSEVPPLAVGGVPSTSEVDSEFLRSRSHLGGGSIDSSEVDRSFRPSSQKTIEDFRAALEEAGIEVTQRYSFGTDIAAACGQLAGESA